MVQYSAIILAAGMSSRMGSYKPLLSTGRASYIRTQISTFYRAGIRDITVVGGNLIDELKEHLSGLAVHLVFNPAYSTSQMFDSLLIGLNETEFKDGVFVTPVDAPLFSEMTVSSLINSDEMISIPVYGGASGHPVFIPEPLAGELRKHDGTGGLGGFLSSHRDSIRHVETQDPFILSDTDTPEEYSRMRDEYAGLLEKELPKEDQILSFLKECGTPPNVIRHSEKVRENALMIADALSGRGILLDRRFLSAVCLLHDLKRTEKDHATEGCAYLKKKGFTKAAEAVRYHHDLPAELTGIINETTVLYIADKMTEEDRTVSVRDRFASREGTFSDPEAIKALEHRRDTACSVMDNINRFAAETIIE